jgi:hypothetical protein
VRGGGKKNEKSEGKFHGKNKYVYNDDLALFGDGSSHSIP